MVWRASKPLLKVLRSIRLLLDNWRSCCCENFRTSPGDYFVVVSTDKPYPASTPDFLGCSQPLFLGKLKTETMAQLTCFSNHTGKFQDVRIIKFTFGTMQNISKHIFHMEDLLSTCHLAFQLFQFLPRHIDELDPIAVQLGVQQATGGAFQGIQHVAITSSAGRNKMMCDFSKNGNVTIKYWYWTISRCHISTQYISIHLNTTEFWGSKMKTWSNTQPRLGLGHILDYGILAFKTGDAIWPSLPPRLH